jgi:hypothetical protein
VEFFGCFHQGAGRRLILKESNRSTKSREAILSFLHEISRDFVDRLAVDEAETQGLDSKLTKQSAYFRLNYFQRSITVG